MSEESTSVTETDTESEEQTESKRQKLETDGVRRRRGGGVRTRGGTAYGGEEHQIDSDEGVPDAVVRGHGVRGRGRRGRDAVHGRADVRGRGRGAVRGVGRCAPADIDDVGPDNV